MQVTIIFPYRNRDVLRVKNALNSLKKQTENDFIVLFIDYGSTKSIASELESIVTQYDFVQYHYLYTQYQPWNKSKAINYALGKVNTPYLFVADIDMIFRNDFVQKAIQLSKQSLNINIYFKVGYLSALESKQDKEFNEYKIIFDSNSEATGLTLFSTFALKSCGGFDEFYHFWGGEDTDVHVRIQNAGFKIVFYDYEILMLHQWHSSYRSLELNKLTQELQLSGVVQFNHQHLRETIHYKKTKVHFLNQNYIVSEEEIRKLEEFNEVVVLNNKKEEIDHFLYYTLHESSNKIIKYQFIIDPFIISNKYKLKRILGKKVPKYYTLKQINDKLLLHIISFYHHLPYIYKVSPDLKSIIFAIQKRSV